MSKAAPPHVVFVAYCPTCGHPQGVERTPREARQWSNSTCPPKCFPRGVKVHRYILEQPRKRGART